MTPPPRFRANITTRYGEAERTTYERVLELARRAGMSRSRAQLILVRWGLRHPDHWVYEWELARAEKGLRQLDKEVRR